MFAVCDGMGGARAGEVASEAACQVLMTVPRDGDVSEGLDRAVHEANARIFKQANAEAALRGMGTTMTAAMATSEGLTFAHVGDSRAYLLRNGEFKQVTEDHSLVGEMVRRGQITRAQAAVHPHRSVITRALGTDESVEPDLFEVPLVPGDRMLLCTDGLSGMVGDAELGRLLGEGDRPREVAEGLIAAALANGGEDNVTAVVVFAVEDDPSGADPDDGDGDPASTREVSFDLDATKEVSMDLDATLEVSVPGDPATDPVEPTAAHPGMKPDTRVHRVLPAEPDSPSFGPVDRIPMPVSEDGFGWSTAERLDALRHRRRLVVLVGAAVAVILLLVIAFLVFNSQVYHVGTSGQNVALFQGVHMQIAGFELYRAVEVTPTRYDSLSPKEQRAVDAHELVSKEDGQLLARSLGVP